MFIAVSRTIAKIGKTRISAGFRITKRNWYYMFFVLLAYWMIMFCIYMVIFAGWCIYAMGYGLVWAIRKIIKLATWANNKHNQEE